jgi:CubicO group peptidase (beta-lactamase class C family)
MTELFKLPFAGSAIVYAPARAYDPKAFPSGGVGMVGTAPCRGDPEGRCRRDLSRDRGSDDTQRRRRSRRWGGVYGTHFWVDRAANLSVVALTNTAVAGMTRAFPLALRRAAYGA